MSLQNHVLPLSLKEKWLVLRRTPRIYMGWLLFAMAVTLVGWGVLFANLKEARTAVERRALLEASALARTYADRLLRSMNAIDQVARHVRADWRLFGGKQLLEHLQEEGAFPSSQYYVTLVNREGMAFSSTLQNFKPMSLGDRRYFQVQKDNSNDQIHIESPLLSRISGKNVVDISRRLVDANGVFDGIVLVSVDVQNFTANYDASILGSYGLLSVISEDRALGVVRIGQNVLPGTLTGFSAPPAFPAVSGSALFEGRKWFDDKRSRFLGWYPVEGYPLTAVVGLDEAEMLADYRHGRHSGVWYAWWATAALAVLTFIAILLSAELAWRSYRLSLAHATYRLATEEGGEGFYIVEPILDHHGEPVDFRVIDCNQQGAGFFQLRKEQLKGRTLSSFHFAPDASIFMNSLTKAFETGEYESEVEVPEQNPLTLRTAQLKVIRSGDNLAVRLRDISEAKAHVAELKRRSNEDVLTSLPNRQWIQGYLPIALEGAQKAGESLALLFIDLDGFKKVNDTAGHAAGDELLQHAAERLLEAIRPHDKVVRFGGDEFLILLEAIEHRIDAAHVAERVQSAFDQPFRLKQGAHTVGTSIGIALYPTDGEDAPALLEKADIAMYSVKTHGKHGYQFYEAKFYNALRERLDKEAEIRDAIARDEFVMYYQPRVHILTGATSSLEALVRWNHPSKGLLEPREFIGLAEETGLIVGIGRLVIEKVCTQLALWAKQGTELVPVSINISPRQFDNADVADLLGSALKHHNVSANLVELEITESSVMAEGGGISTMLASLHEKGIKILVDDFGTGYSSLSQLHRLDFDVLKVDQSFTVGIDKSDESKVFFQAIVTMAHALGMRVVAEGVETLAQIEILKSLKCDEIQGFYISKPIPPGKEQPILPKWFSPIAT